MTEHKHNHSEKIEQAACAPRADEKRREDQLQKVRQPGPAKNVGDDTANPLPDDFSNGDGGDGSDAGRV